MNLPTISVLADLMALRVPIQLQAQMWLGCYRCRSSRDRTIQSLNAVAQKRWKCPSHTSNAFLDWDASDSEAHASQMTNSSLPQPPKTFANWPRSFLHRSERVTPDKKGDCAQFRTPLSAPATRCFSTESAERRRSPLVRDSPMSSSLADIGANIN